MIRMRTFAEDAAGGSSPGATAPESSGSAITRAVEAAREAETDAAPAPVNKGGRPRGKKDSKPRARPRSAGAAASPPGEPAPPPAEPSEAEIATVAFAWAVIWKLLAAKSGRFRLLTEEETQELAGATLPVLNKYAGNWDEWAPEIALGMAIFGLVQITALEPALEPTPERPNENGSHAQVVP